MEKYLRVDDSDYIYYVANLLIIIEIYDKKILVLRSEIITLVLLLM